METVAQKLGTGQKFLEIEAQIMVSNNKVLEIVVKM